MLPGPLPGDDCPLLPSSGPVSVAAQPRLQAAQAQRCGSGWLPSISQTLPTCHLKTHLTRMKESRYIPISQTKVLFDANSDCCCLTPGPGLHVGALWWEPETARGALLAELAPDTKLQVLQVASYSPDLLIHI